MIELNYVTRNWAKIEAARQILTPLGIHVKQVDFDCPEIQSDSIVEVAINASKYASQMLKGMVLKNDTGLRINALNNFPNAYTHYVEDTIGNEGILKLLEGVENRKADFVECFALTLLNGETKTFESCTRGKISLSESGNYGWGYDKIFIPDGCDMTLGNYDDNQRFKLWDDSGYVLLARYLKSIS